MLRLPKEAQGNGQLKGKLTTAGPTSDFHAPVNRGQKLASAMGILAVKCTSTWGQVSRLWARTGRRGKT